MSEHEFELYLELLGKFLRLRPGQRVEIADELRDHLEARLEELSRGGMSRADAVRRALDEFGDAACLADHFSQLARERKKRFLMRCTLGTVSAAALVLIVGTAFWPQYAGVQVGSAPSTAWAKPDAKDAKEKDPNELSAATDVDPDDRVNQILDREKTTLEFSQTPVTEALEFLSERLGVDIVRSRDLSNNPEDVYSKPVTLSVRNTQLTGRAALQLVLEQVGLSFVVRDGLILVRTPESALSVAMIDVQPFLTKDDSGAGQHLVDTIQRMVQPNDWVDSGGLYGTISIYNGLLIVRHTPEAIREVREFVQQLHDESLKLGRVK